MKKKRRRQGGGACGEKIQIGRGPKKRYIGRKEQEAGRDDTHT